VRVGVSMAGSEVEIAMVVTGAVGWKVGLRGIFAQMLCLKVLCALVDCSVLVLSVVVVV
jgi:hypothetical protein